MSKRSRRGLVTTVAGSVVLTLATAPAAAELGLDQAFLDAGPLEAGNAPAKVKGETLKVKVADASLSITLASTKGRVTGLFVSTKSAAGPFILFPGTRVVTGEDGSAEVNADLASLTSGPKKAPNLHVLLATAVWDGKAFKDVRATHAASVKVEAGKITHLAGKAVATGLTAQTISKAAGIKGGGAIIAPSVEASSPNAVLSSAELFPPRSRPSR